jgi:Leucine-rich repeat (LRR) protein
LTTLDVSKNKLTRLDPKLSTLSNLKIFNCDDNLLVAGSLEPVAKLTKLQNLSVGGNQLGKPVTEGQLAHVGEKLMGKEVSKAGQKLLGQDVPTEKQPDPLPNKLPLSLKQLKLNANFFSSVPRVVCTLTKLQKLDLSQNHLASVPVEITNLQALNELNLNDNVIVSLPEEIGSLSKLKSLSLKNNHIRVSGGSFSAKNPQPLPASLFTKTPLIDLNLHGCPMTSTQLNTFDGYSSFLERREKTNTKNIFAGVMANLDVCGLE